MNSYELHIDTSPGFNRINGQFLKGHIPFNKGVPMSEWMDKEKIKKVMKYLKLGRGKGNSFLARSNKRGVVGIRDGKIYPFESAVDAGRLLRAKGIRVNSRNICAVCHKKKVKTTFGKYEYSYIRKKAGGFQWFFTEDVEKYISLINI